MANFIKKARARRILLSAEQENLLLELYDAPNGMTVTVSKFSYPDASVAFYVKHVREDGEEKTALMSQEEFYDAIEFKG